MLRKQMLIGGLVAIGLLSACGAQERRTRTSSHSEAKEAENPEKANTNAPETNAPETKAVEAETPAVDKPADTATASNSCAQGIAPASNNLPSTTVSGSGPIATALNAAINGPMLLSHEVYGHTWVIPQAEIFKDGCRIRIEGYVMERLSPYMDPVRYPTFHDRAYYEFVFENGKLVTQDFWIQRRNNPAKIVAPVVAAIGAYYGVPISAKTIEDFLVTIDKMDDAEFDAASQKLAMRIGLEAYAKASKTP